MTELKTLKDLRWEIELSKYDITGFVIKEEELKKEAIKWVKFYEKFHTVGGIETKDWPPFNPEDFIKFFFNITEEELK